MVYVRRNRTTKVLKWSLVVIFLILIVSIAFLFIMNSMKVNDNTRSKMTFTDNFQSQAKLINVLRTRCAVQAGDAAETTKFEIVALPENLVPDEIVTSFEEIKDKRIACNLTQKEFVMKADLMQSSAWYSDDDRLIEHIFQSGSIPSSVIAGSIVDIKLYKQHEKDCVVISKAVVVNKQGDTLSFYLNSMEQEYLKEAASEGSIYMTQYLNFSQPSSEITYKVGYPLEDEASE